MNVYRYEENPLVTPADVKPHERILKSLVLLMQVLQPITMKLSCFFV